MSKESAARRLQLGNVLWAQESTNPNAGGGTAGPVGSLWSRASAFPTPVQTFVKVNTTATGWVLQNLVNLKIFNVKTYGAVGDGVTNDLAAILSAVAAAVAAGGGGIYFPATANFYNVVKAASRDLIELADVFNLTFFGDGYASKLKQTGTVGLAESHLFGVRNQSSRIAFYNFMIDGSGITSPDPGEQNHGINIYGSASLPAPGPSDVEIVGMYMGQFPGTPLRHLGEQNKDVINVRTMYSAFDVKSTTGSRSGVEAQRHSKRIMVHFNWITGSHDQQIDFEPTGIGAIGDDGGPSEWSIVGNMMDHESQTQVAVALSGQNINEDTRARHTIYAHNYLFRGGVTSGRNMTQCVIMGNICNQTDNNTGSTMEFFENTTNILFNANIIDSEGEVLFSPFSRDAFRTEDQNSGFPSHVVVQNNIMRTRADGAVGGGVGSFVDTSQAMFVGNMLSMASVPAGLSSGFTSRAVNANVSLVSCVGNMTFSEGPGNLLTGFIFSVSAGKLQTDTLFEHNWVSGGSTNGLRWDAVTSDWRGAIHNAGIGVTSGFISGVQEVIDGNPGTGTQIAGCAISAGPEASVNAPVGSMATNNFGGQNNVLFVKDAGSGVSGGSTGWMRYGGTEIVMGALASTTATAARFFAPGGQDLTTESTVEIQWTVPRPGVIRNLYIKATAGTGGGTNTFTVNKNGVATTLVAGLANTGSSGADLTHSFTVAAGDLISLQVAKSSAPTTPQTNIVATMEFL